MLPEQGRQWRLKDLFRISQLNGRGRLLCCTENSMKKGCVILCPPLAEQGPLRTTTTGHAFSVCPIPCQEQMQALLGAMLGAWAEARALAGPLGCTLCSSCCELVPHSYAHGAEKSPVFWRWCLCGIGSGCQCFLRSPSVWLLSQRTYFPDRAGAIQ